MGSLKLKQCSGCDKESVIFSRGRCKQCSMIDYSKKPSSIVPKDRNRNLKLDAFFDRHIANLKYCQETNIKIIFPSRCNICHLFNKRHFKSVMYNDFNVIYLDIDQHTKLDKIILDRLDFHKLEKEFPNTWKEIVYKMNKVRKGVTEVNKFIMAFDTYINKLGTFHNVNSF